MKWFKVIGLVVVALGLFVFGYGWREVQHGQAPRTDGLVGLIGGKPTPAADSPEKVFRDSYAAIKADYRKDVDLERLRYAGMAGLMASLGDPHTVFMEPKSAEEFKLETRATFAGIGARLAPDPLGARVAVVFDEGPASRAGMKAGDLIISVNGKQVGGIEVDKIVDNVRGPEGSAVTIVVAREGATKPITLKITRARIIVPTVTSKVLPNRPYGYIEMSMFSEPTADQFAKAVDKLEKAGIKGLILDLRGNPGGLLESATEILSYFADDKPVVTMRMRSGRVAKETTYTGLKRNWRYPVITLVNESSASAAEIMAGVMKGYGLTTLVGEHTYGKASVQTVFPLRDGSGAKVTIARYYLPNGDDISRKVDEDGMYISGGLKVDVEVKLQDEPTPILGDPKTDNQLMKAIEVLDGKAKPSVKFERLAPTVVEQLGLDGAGRIA